MKKYSILFGFALALLVSGCKDDGRLEPSNLDINWYEIKNTPGDALQQIRYEVYHNSGISLFMSDTLGKQVRHDAFGKEYVHAEVIPYGYIFTTSIWYGQFMTLNYSKDTALLITCAKTVRDKVIPALKRLNKCPRVIMMADKVVYKYQAQIYRDPTKTAPSTARQMPMNCTAYLDVAATIVAATKLKTISEDEFVLRILAEYYKKIFREEYAGDYANYMNISYSTTSEAYPGMTVSVSTPGKYFYGQACNGITAPYDYSTQVRSKDIRTWGFFTRYDLSNTSTYFISEDEDISEFFYRALAANTPEKEAAFLADNASYKMVLNKFAIAKKVVDAIGR